MTTVMTGALGSDASQHRSVDEKNRLKIMILCRRYVSHSCDRVSLPGHVKRQGSISCDGDAVAECLSHSRTAPEATRCRRVRVNVSTTSTLSGSPP
jgi:hypothetical protein